MMMVVKSKYTDNYETKNGIDTKSKRFTVKDLGPGVRD